MEDEGVLVPRTHSFLPLCTQPHRPFSNVQLPAARFVGAAVGAHVCPLDVGRRVGALLRALHVTPTSSACPQLCFDVFRLQLLKRRSVPLQARSSKWMAPLPPPTVPKLAAGPIPSSRQATLASGRPKLSSQTVPHTPL